MNRSDLIQVTEAGLYCPAGDFYIDAWSPVERCIVTHAHSDHAHPGCAGYLTSAQGKLVLKARLGDDISVEKAQYGEPISMGETTVQLLPAGHILGSAQVQISRRGEVWVVSSDYKTVKDPTCEPFEAVKCNTFVTESTFGLPIYQWRPPHEVLHDINSWWRGNAEQEKCSVLFGYALGKAQRILAGLDPSIGPIYMHGAVARITQVYRECGVLLPQAQHTGSLPKGTKFAGSIVLAPPSAQNSLWMRQFGTVSTAFASGWMRIRGVRRRKSIDKGFVLSDHADWNEMNSVIAATGAERILVTHGYAAEMVRWLRERNLNAESLSTKFEGEREEMQPSADETDPNETDSQEAEPQE